MPSLSPDSIISINFYECDRHYQMKENENDGHCDLNINTTHCTPSSIGWSAGSDLTVYFADDLGYPIGGDSDYGHLILNIEFNDPNEYSSIFYYE